jgi:hypothetical protein
MSACSRCGATVAESVGSCPLCGAALTGPVAAAPVTDSNAVLSLVLGVLSVTVVWILAAIPAIVLGHVSRSHIRRSQGRLKGRNMAAAGLVLGYISVATLPLLLASVAVPAFFKSRSDATEHSALTTLRRITSAAAEYKLTYSVYPPSIQALGPAPSGTASADAAGLLPADAISHIAAGKDGYHFTYQHVTNQDGFVIHADPASSRSSLRYFYADQTGIVRSEVGRTADSGSPIDSWRAR